MPRSEGGIACQQVDPRQSNRHWCLDRRSFLGLFAPEDPPHAEPLMNEAEVICTLLIVVAALAILAKKAALPYPVLLVIGGLALGFVPGLPAGQFKPGLGFLFFFPPFL